MNLQDTIESAKKFRAQFGALFDLVEAAEQVIAIQGNTDALIAQADQAKADKAQAEADTETAKAIAAEIINGANADAEQIGKVAAEASSKILEDAKAKAGEMFDSAQSHADAYAAKVEQSALILADTQQKIDAANAELQAVTDKIAAVKKAAAELSK